MVGAFTDSPLIKDRADLVSYFERGSKPSVDWRIGTEHEKFAYRRADFRPLPYDGKIGIRAILERLQGYGWAPVLEGENIIALTLDGQAVTLEPSGAVELSGAPVENLHQTCREVNTHLAQVKKIGDELGIGFFGLGYHPKWRHDDMPLMPKGRYGIMSRYMPTRGSLGLDMMFRTCTVQVNLDYASEADMVKKLQVALRLQPIATALFANSPFKEGKPNGFLSYRSYVWTDTDPDRTGFLPFAFEDGMGFERYTDYVLDVPMYFIHRGEEYVDVAGCSFRDFMEGKLEKLPGERPTLQDWEDHVSTAFPEVRLKRFLELRGADGGPWGRLCALPALWVGLLYETSALDAAYEMTKDWSHSEVVALHEDVTRRALKAEFRGHPVQAIAREVINISSQGLRGRGVLDSIGDNEDHFLNPLRAIAETGVTPAEELLEAYEARWGSSIDPVFEEYAY